MVLATCGAVLLIEATRKRRRGGDGCFVATLAKADMKRLTSLLRVGTMDGGRLKGRNVMTESFAKENLQVDHGMQVLNICVGVAELIVRVRRGRAS